MRNSNTDIAPRSLGYPALAARRCWLWLPLIAWLIASAPAAGENRFSDPTFTKVQELGLTEPARGWHWQRIVAPCQVVNSADRPGVTLSGGKVRVIYQHRLSPAVCVKMVRPIRMKNSRIKFD